MPWGDDHFMWPMQRWFVRNSAERLMDAVTATTLSDARKIFGYNSLMLHVHITGGTWNISIKGGVAADGVFEDVYDNNGFKLETGGITSGVCRLFAPIPDYYKVEATLSSGSGTCTIDTQPINV